MYNYNKKSVDTFINSLKEILELKEGKKFNELFKINKNGVMRIKEITLHDINADDRTTLYKYIIYLYAGALAMKVNKTMNETKSKGLNYDILKMSNTDFENFLITNKPLMNNSFAQKYDADVKTSTEIFNDTINEMKKYLTETEEKRLINIIYNIEKIFRGGANDIELNYRPTFHPKFPRFYFNIKRGLKKLFGCQDFSYASKEYKEIFENIFNTLDSTKGSNKIKK